MNNDNSTPISAYVRESGLHPSDFFHIYGYLCILFLRRGNLVRSDANPHDGVSVLFLRFIQEPFVAVYDYLFSISKDMLVNHDSCADWRQMIRFVLHVHVSYLQRYLVGHR
jgi:hypothetical protein